MIGLRIGLGRTASLAIAVAIGADCTRENPGYGAVAHATGSTEGSGSPETDASAAGTSTTRADQTGANEGESMPDDGTTQDDGGESDETSDTVGICPEPLPVPFDVKVTGGMNDPGCVHDDEWTGTLLEIGPHAIGISACVDAACPCPETEAELVSFEFDDLEVDRFEQLPLEPCVTVTIHRDADPECSVAWAVVRVHPEGIASQVLAATNRPVPELTDPPIGLRDPLCVSEMKCRDDRLRGPYTLGLSLLDQELAFKPGEPLESVPLTVLETPGTYLLEARFALIDETCQTRIGWTAIGTGER